MADTKIVAKDEYIIREGEASTEMYYLNKGTLAIYKRKGDHEKQIGTIYSGELVGEMSFLDNEPRSASVKATTESELTIIPREKLNKQIENQPSWVKVLLSTLTERLRKANHRIRI